MSRAPYTRSSMSGNAASGADDSDPSVMTGSPSTMGVTAFSAALRPAGRVASRVPRGRAFGATTGGAGGGSGGGGVGSRGAPIISQDQAEQAVTDAGAEPAVAQAVAQAYADTQVASLRQSLFLVFALSVVGLLLSRGLPATVGPTGPPGPAGEPARPSKSG